MKYKILDIKFAVSENGSANKPNNGCLRSFSNAPMLVQASTLFNPPESVVYMMSYGINTCFSNIGN